MTKNNTLRAWLTTHVNDNVAVVAIALVITIALSAVGIGGAVTASVRPMPVSRTVGVPSRTPVETRAMIKQKKPATKKPGILLRRSASSQASSEQ